MKDARVDFVAISMNNKPSMLDFLQSLINSTLSTVLQHLHYPREVMLVCGRRFVAYPFGLRRVAEMMQDRVVFVDHFTVHRWALEMLPVLTAGFPRRKRPMGSNWLKKGQMHRPAGSNVSAADPFYRLAV